MQIPTSVQTKKERYDWSSDINDFFTLIAFFLYFCLIFPPFEIVYMKPTSNVNFAIQINFRFVYHKKFSLFLLFFGFFYYYYQWTTTLKMIGKSFYFSYHHRNQRRRRRRRIMSSVTTVCVLFHYKYVYKVDK